MFSFVLIAVGRGLDAAVAVVALSKVIGEGIGHYQVASHTYTIAGIVALLTAKLMNNSELFPKGKTCLLFMCALLANFAIVCTDFAFKRCRTGDALTIRSASPLLVAIFGRVFLGERSGFFECVNLVSSFAGASLVFKPFQGWGAYNYDALAYVAVVVGTMFVAGWVVCLRALKNVDPFVIFAWTGLIGILPPLALALISADALAVPSWTDSAILATVAALTLGSQLCDATAFKFGASAGSFALIRMSVGVLVSLGVGVANSGAGVDNLTAIGASILASCVVATALKMCSTGKPDSEKEDSECDGKYTKETDTSSA